MKIFKPRLLVLSIIIGTHFMKYLNIKYKRFKYFNIFIYNTIHTIILNCINLLGNRRDRYVYLVKFKHVSLLFAVDETIYVCHDFD